MLHDLNDRLAAIEPVLENLHYTVQDLKAHIDPTNVATASEAINTAASNLAVGDASLSNQDLQRITLANSVAELTSNNKSMVLIADRDDEVKAISDLAYKYDSKSIAEALPETGLEADNIATGVVQKLYEASPGPTVAGLVESGRISLSHSSVKGEVVVVLKEMDALAAPLEKISERVATSLKGVKPQRAEAVMKQVKKLRRINAIAPTTTSLAGLARMKLTSANAVASMAPTDFIKTAVQVDVPKAEAQQMYTNATNTVTRNTNLLLTTVDIGRGTAPIMDGRRTKAGLKVNMREVAARLGLRQVNLETIFGGNDERITEEWGTIYGPAAYLVDLLQYLEKAKIEKDPNNKTNVLQYLLRRRPDLAKLELTKENTEVVVPYVDIVNEIMESFIENFALYLEDKVQDPKQSNIEAFNVDTRSAADLLWRPENTNIDAYAYLADSIFPLTLPYHQPLDTTRRYLRFLQIDRASLIDKFRSRPASLTDENALALCPLHEEKLDCMHDAECLELSEEEYILLTREGFQSPEYYEISQNIDRNKAIKQYGIRPLHEHFGYQTSVDLKATDGTGLESVQGQFLRRTGISWIELVALVSTGFINQDKPQGRDMFLTEAFPASYRYLQTLVIPGTVTKDASQWVRAALNALEQENKTSASKKDIQYWVEKFADIGHTIVLEHNDGPFLQFKQDQVEGQDLQVVAKTKAGAKLPTQSTGTSIFDRRALTAKAVLRGNGLLVDESGIPFGNVDKDGRLLCFGSNAGGTPIGTNFKFQTFELHASSGTETTPVATVDEKGFVKLSGTLAKGLAGTTITYKATSSNGGTADIEAVTLKHLDGTSLQDDEWDRMQLFIRLWRKLRWSIEEVDMALAAVQAAKQQERAQDDPATRARISPSGLRQLVVIKMVAEFTGFSLEDTLTLWQNISTTGKNSLYSRLFLRRNTPGTSRAFEPDKYGNVMVDESSPGTLSRNALGVMANLDLKLADLEAAISKNVIEDKLTLNNISLLYRCKNLSRFLGVTVPQLLDLLRIFEQPLAQPQTTLAFLHTWRALQGAGFTVEEVDYVTQASPRTLPGLLSIDGVKIAITCKQVHDQISSVRRTHRSLPANEEGTATMVRAKVGALFGEEKIDSVMSFLDGTATYTVKAAAKAKLGEIPAKLKSVFKYVDAGDAPGDEAKIYAIGILTADELASLKGLVTITNQNSQTMVTDWEKSSQDLSRQPAIFFSTVLAGIFPPDTLAEKTLLKPLAGAFSATAATVVEKYTFFVNNCVKYLVAHLSQAAVVSSMAALTDTSDQALTSSLLNIITTETQDGKTESGLANLLRVGEQIADHGKDKVWEGYLLVPQTDEYVFHFNSPPTGFHIDNKVYPVQGTKKEG